MVYVLRRGAAGQGEFGRYGKYMFDDERITWSVDGGGRFFYRSPHKYSVTNVCGWMTVDNDRVRTKFLYYVLTSLWKKQTFDYTRKAHPSVIRDAYTVPIPATAEQDRIVNTLDKFVALVNDLSIGLPAELAARRRQYEHYRDRLLTFPERHYGAEAPERVDTSEPVGAGKRSTVGSEGRPLQRELELPA